MSIISTSFHPRSILSMSGSSPGPPSSSASWPPSTPRGGRRSSTLQRHCDMNKAKSSYKEEAQTALARGDLKRALDNYQKHCAQEPEDIRSCVKIGELLERLDRKKEAVEVYR